MSARTPGSLLVYYFGFPHYRKAILTELLDMPDVDVELVSGSTTRDSIATLSESELPGLQVLPSLTLGPFTWDREIARDAISRRDRTVVLGPALSSLTTWLILIARHALGRPTYLWGQCGRLGDRSLRRRVQEVMNRLATGLLVYGRAEAKAATELGTPERKVHIVNNATSSNAAARTEECNAIAFERLQIRAEDARARGILRLAFIGRLTSDKKLDVLAAACEELDSKYDNFHLDIVGDGPLRSELEHQMRGLPVTFHGWVYSDVARDAILERVTLVVSPFHMGLVAVDSLRFGTPVLVPDNPMCGSEVEALTPGLTSLVFKAGDAGDIVRAAEEWVNLAGSLRREEYEAARSQQLRRWDPRGVARAIVIASNGAPG